MSNALFIEIIVKSQKYLLLKMFILKNNAFHTLHYYYRN
jgi:hypothetical protein